MPWLRGLRVGLVALWWPRLCVPTVLPSVEKGLLGRGRWDKPLPAGRRREGRGKPQVRAGERRRWRASAKQAKLIERKSKGSLQLRLKQSG